MNVGAHSKSSSQNYSSFCSTSGKMAYFVCSFNERILLVNIYTNWRSMFSSVFALWASEINFTMNFGTRKLMAEFTCCYNDPA